jgi:hypothetical protein
MTRGEQRAIASVIVWVTEIDYLELLRASECTLSCWSQLHLQSIAPATNPHSACVVGVQTSYIWPVIIKQSLSNFI